MIEIAKQKALADKIECESELARMQAAKELDLKYAALSINLEVEKAKKMARIEIDNHKKIVSALGRETIKLTSNGTQNHQAKMFETLGLSSSIITDSLAPLNLFNAITY